jgi:glycosyltransferase involved in cell wall biosynthesis
MKIAIDLRSLSSGTVSGVENYCLNLLENLLPLDKKNSYTLFYNSWSKRPMGDFHFVNSQVKSGGWPNRLLNLGLKFGFTKLESLAGEFDCLFMPNLNQFNIESNKKLVITVHDLSPVITPEFYDLKRNIWHKFLNYKKAFQRADKLLAVSEYTKNDLIKVFNINPKKIEVIYPGAPDFVASSKLENEDLRKLRNNYDLPGDFILFLNTIEPRKNLANTIKAFERLNDNSSLVIVGRKGWKWRADFNMIKQSKKSAKIKYMGYFPEEDKLALIKLSKTLIYPSFYEGFGFQPLEAMAVGTPVITSQITSLPEVVGNAALLVNPYDIESIMRALEATLDNEELRKSLTLKGLEQVKKFTWQKTAQQTLSALSAL